MGFSALPRHVPATHVSPADVHPEVATPTVPQMHRLLSASQVGDVVVESAHVAAEPHMHTPLSHVSSGIVHPVVSVPTVPHIH